MYCSAVPPRINLDHCAIDSKGSTWHIVSYPPTHTHTHKKEFTNKHHFQKLSFIPLSHYSFLWNILVDGFGALPHFSQSIYKCLVGKKVNTAGQTLCKPLLFSYNTCTGIGFA